MSLTAVCLPFEYEKHAKYRHLPGRCEALRMEAHANKSLVSKHLADTRAAHKAEFSGLTPPSQEYMAGNYRGSDYPCLKDYQVTIDGFLGEVPSDVESAMHDFHVTFLDVLKRLIDIKNSQQPKLTESRFVEMMSSIVAEFYVLLLRIHPYADGNGHMARLLGYMICLELGRRPKNWPLHKRPPFGNSVRLYRSGFQEELKIAVLKAIAG
jgi:hypothetical protein